MPHDNGPDENEKEIYVRCQICLTHAKILVYKNYEINVDVVISKTCSKDEKVEECV